MMDLLPRFYDVQEGAITIDDFDIKKLKIKDLRGLIGIVSQESILFNDTIKNNLLIGSENSSNEEVLESSKNANAHEFIINQEKVCHLLYSFYNKHIHNKKNNCFLIL